MGTPIPPSTTSTTRTNTYNNYSIQSLCETCPIGYICKGIDDLPSICPAGYICNQPALSQPDRVLIGGGNNRKSDIASVQKLVWVYKHWVPEDRILINSIFR